MSDYCISDIEEALKRIGIKYGDDIFIHSNIGFFGRLENCQSRDQLCDAFLNSIYHVIGKNGTAVFPTFSYSFCHGELFDPNYTKTTCGLLSQYVLEQTSAVRSLDPNFSIAAIGDRANYYTEHPTHESFGKGCFFERFVNHNGKIVCMNFDAGSTFIHYIECKNAVEYRYNKAFNGMIQDGEKKRKDYFVHFVYSLEKPEDAPCMPNVNSFCKRYHLFKKTKLGKGALLAMPSKIYCEMIEKELRANPRFMTIGGSEIRNEQQEK